MTAVASDELDELDELERAREEDISVPQNSNFS